MKEFNINKYALLPREQKDQVDAWFDRHELELLKIVSRPNDNDLHIYGYDEDNNCLSLAATVEDDFPWEVIDD